MGPLLTYRFLQLRACTLMPFEPVREKTNNLGPDQVRHKSGCTKDSIKLEALNLKVTIQAPMCIHCTADLRVCFRICTMNRWFFPVKAHLRYMYIRACSEWLLLSIASMHDVTKNGSEQPNHT